MLFSRDAASNQFSSLYSEVEYAVFSVEYGVAGLNNSNNDSMVEVFPNTTYVLSRILMDDIYGNMQFELFYGIGDSLYFEIVLSAISFALGGDLYWQEYLKYSELWLESGLYKQKVAQAFEQTGEHLPYLGNQTFDEFIDFTYVDFSFEELHHMAFPVLYQSVYDLLLLYGHDINLNKDKIKMSTDFMR